MKSHMNALEMFNNNREIQSWTQYQLSLCMLFVCKYSRHSTAATAELSSPYSQQASYSQSSVFAAELNLGLRHGDAGERL